MLRRNWHCHAVLLTSGVLLLLAQTVSAAGAGDAGRLSGWVLERAGYGLSSDHDQLVLNQQLLELEWKPPTLRDWHADVKVWAERENELEPRTTAELTLRELTVRRESSRYALTLGRQIVVWGKADGFRLLDLVNPLDLREFVLGDQLRRRMPLWMANLQYYPDPDQQFQLLLIPQTYHDRLPGAGSEFDWTASLPPDADILPLQEPSDQPRNWSYGLRWSTTYGDWDIGLIGLHNLTGAPVLFPSLTPRGRLQLRPEVVTRTVLGANADWNVGAAVVRLELAVSPDEYRAFTSREGLPYLKKQTTLRALLGIDWYVHNWLISPQLFDVEGAGSPGIAGDPDGSFASLVLEHKFYYDKLTLRLFAASALTRADYWIALKLRYQLLDHLELSAAGDWLGGDRDGFFGQFGNRDRIVLAAKIFY